MTDNSTQGRLVPLQWRYAVIAFWDRAPVCERSESGPFLSRDAAEQVAVGFAKSGATQVEIVAALHDEDYHCTLAEREMMSLLARARKAPPSSGEVQP